MVSKAFQKVTDRIIEKLEEGVIPWRKPWGSRTPGGLPRNLTTGKPYRGCNLFMTAMQDYSSPWWLTFKQCRDRGGSVRKGEQGTPILYWNWFEKTTERDGEERKRKLPFAKLFHAFNIEQTDGLDIPMPTSEPEPAPFEPIELAEEIVALMPQRPEISHGGSRAYYEPLADSITMPPKDSFHSGDGYYSTLFHELAHATGHASRLGRNLSGRFGSSGYAREELVAELTSSYLCGESGLDNDRSIENHASYIASWLQRLKNDASLVPVAAQQAQKAADFILVAEESAARLEVA